MPGTTEIQKREVSVLGSTMSYVDTGSDGPVALFLHGNPTSSYIWRNIIPHVSPRARCIAPDLIGFGESGKPEIDYGFFDHVRYLDAFLEALGLSRMALVAQDWGAALAFHYAARHPDAVLGLAFMEFVHPVPAWDEYQRNEQARQLFKAFRRPGVGERLILNENIFVERLLPGSVLRRLSDEEMDAYRSPFPTPASRKPILKLPRELPIAGEPPEVCAAAEAGYAALRSSVYPKLLFSGEPGALVSPEAAEALAAEMQNCRLVRLGAGAHYLQEDHPDGIGQEFASWIATEAPS
jgi:haloalkane dehalogenase